MDNMQITLTKPNRLSLSYVASDGTMKKAILDKDVVLEVREPNLVEALKAQSKTEYIEITFSEVMTETPKRVIRKTPDNQVRGANDETGTEES